MNLLSFIQTADPTKVRVDERQRAEDEPKLMDTTVGRVVPLLPIAPARAESELDASVDKLFDEGGSGNLVEQGDSAGGGHVVGSPLVSEAAETVVEDVAPLQPKRQRKRKTFVSDTSGPSHPPKKLREDHETSIGLSVAGTSMSALQRLLAGAVLNPEVGIAALPTLPFIISSVSVTPERESEDQTDSMAGANLRTINAPPRFVISSNSSHHSGANIAEAEVDSFARPSIPLMTVATTVTSIVDPATTFKEKFVGSSVFGGDSSGGGADHTIGGFSDLTSSDFIIGGIRTVISPDTDLQKFFASIRGIDHDQLFMEFNVGAACQMSLSAEVRMRAEYNIRERRRLNSVVEEKNSLLKARDAEIESLKAQLLVKEAEVAEAIRLCAEASKFEAIEKSLQSEVRVLKDYNTTLEKEKSELDVKVADLVASVKVSEQEAVDLDAMVTFVKSQNDNLVDQVHELETYSVGLQEKFAAYENCMGKLEEFQDEQIRVMNDKFEKLYVDFVEIELHLEEKFYPHLLTTIAGRRWLLTYGVKRVIVKSAGITHGQEGRVLKNIAAFNPSAESDYISALQELQDVNFSLLAELKSNKDASTETLMNILHLDEPLTERLGLDESQPHVDQLLVPIHHSPDRSVIGANSLLFSLDVSRNQVQKIRDNIANHRSALLDAFVSLIEPLSSVALEGMEGTFSTAPETITALSVTFASTSFIPPISTNDYDVHADGQEGTGADGQAGAGADVKPFPDVEDAELDIS
ncbi:hypothetical protein Tco_0858534 [Tanacetum coccineum]|uniref:Transposase (Putative), gypsy type n=1 Tax=Tanacetum coccineum TaxID=301880 RepID=A0ABQ5BBL0_9ASTR